MKLNNGPKIIRITFIPFHLVNKADVYGAQKFSPMYRGRVGGGRLNEEVEEGLRDYRRGQSAKKCTSTYSLLGKTYIIVTGGGKDGLSPLCVHVFFF